MPLADLLDCEGLDDAQPSSYCSLLRVAFQNLLIALERGHIDRGDLVAVFHELLDGIAGVAPERRPIHVDRVYEMLVSILTREAPALFFSRGNRLLHYLDERPVSLQPSWAFKYWLDDDLVHEARLETHTPAEVESLVRDFEEADKRRPDATVGYPLLWLTPLGGAVREIVRRAREAYADAGIAGLEESNCAQHLRDLLGIERRLFPEWAVALMFDRTIGELQDEAESVVAATADALPRPRRRFAAPTQFDAGDYPRFRHWPTDDGLEDPDYGRTWNLTVDLGAGPRGGTPELVSEPLALESVVGIISLGPIRTVTPTEEEARELDAAFAEAICGTTTLRALVPLLAKQLEL